MIALKRLVHLTASIHVQWLNKYPDTHVCCRLWCDPLRTPCCADLGTETTVHCILSIPKLKLALSVVLSLTGVCLDHLPHTLVLYIWTLFMKLGAIRFDQSLYVITIPAGLVRSSLAHSHAQHMARREIKFCSNKIECFVKFFVLTHRVIIDSEEKNKISDDFYSDFSFTSKSPT